MLALLLQIDRACFYAVNQSGRNLFFDWIMPALSGYKGAWAAPALIMAYFLLRGSSRVRKVILLLVLVFAMTDMVSSRILKPVFERPRPFAVLTEVHYFKGEWKESSVNPPAGHQGTLSFPSSHAVNSAGAATVLIYFFPRLWPGLTILVFLIGYSRIYLGLHYPLDILAGIIIGFIVAGLALISLDRLAGRFPALSAWLPEAGKTG